MPDFPIIEAQRHEAAYTAADSLGVSVTSGASHTKSAAWVELISSTAFDATLLIVEVLVATGSNNVDFLVDLAIGGAGSEQILVANVAGSSLTSVQGYGKYAFPIQVPAGTRISAKSQTTAAALAVRVAVSLYSQGMIAATPFSAIDTIGANTADSGGTSIDPGGVANTLAWGQLDAAADYDYRGFILCVGTAVNTSRADQSWIIHVGIGGAGSEQKIYTCQIWIDVSSEMVSYVSPFIPYPIPAGVRLAVGGQCSIIDATDRLFDATLYMVR